MVDTLNKTYPEGYRQLKLRGYKYIPLLMEIYTKATQMDKALGYNGAASKWITLSNDPSNVSEEKAKNLYNKLLKTEDVIPEIKEPEKTHTFMLLVPKDNVSKVQKILEMLNCEFIEI